MRSRGTLMFYLLNHIEERPAQYFVHILGSVDFKEAEAVNGPCRISRFSVLSPEWQITNLPIDSAGWASDCESRQVEKVC
jgi:hypothetical protein